MILYAAICNGLMGSWNTKTAIINPIIGLILSNIPTVDEFNPFKAYKFKNRGITVKPTAINSMSNQKSFSVGTDPL